MTGMTKTLIPTRLLRPLAEAQQPSRTNISNYFLINQILNFVGRITDFCEYLTSVLP